ncbi:MAG TPA: class I SAM-dependent methyltransferase [Candidatus Acidoferrales bacterium]|nr:class I SAM-dependent methyltransferase [Candidatus Acidoferrales bacterium]
MSEPHALIRHISDTARWAAVYRARETDRSDALFRDPYARRLAGERGERIASALPFHEKNSWAWVTRTWLFDRFISEQIDEGVDMVVNLAAGLDARPYRMALPRSLVWIEADLPEILGYKEEILKPEKPACTLERVRVDLADASARGRLFEAWGGRAAKALVLSEGLLGYLTDDQVGALAEDLARTASFRRWAIDLSSPGLRKMVEKNTRAQFGDGVPLPKFAPEAGPQFFTRYGWNPLEVRSVLKTAAGLRRLTAFMRLMALLPENPSKSGSRPWSGVCLLAKD